MNTNDLDMKNFFKLKSKLSSSTAQVHLTDKTIDHLRLIKGDYQGIEFPLVFKHEFGKKFLDILDTGYPGFLIISERIKSALEEHHLSGWKVFSIIILDKKNNEIAGYYGFSVTGKCSPTRYDNSQIIEKRRVSNGLLCKFYKGVFVDSWDGSDFFIPQGTSHTFVSKQAANVLKQSKISNMELQCLAETEIAVNAIRSNAKER